MDKASIGLALAVFRLAQGARDCEARDLCSLASPGIPAGLALEIAAARTPRAAEEHSCARAANGAGKSNLGRGANCRRALWLGKGGCVTCATEFFADHNRTKATFIRSSGFAVPQIGPHSFQLRRSDAVLIRYILHPQPKADSSLQIPDLGNCTLRVEFSGKQRQIYLHSRKTATSRPPYLIEFIGRRGRNRTCDPLLRRQMLYPLSYAPLGLQVNESRLLPRR